MRLATAGPAGIKPPCHPEPVPSVRGDKIDGCGAGAADCVDLFAGHYYYLLLCVPPGGGERLLSVCLDRAGLLPA